MPASGPWKRLSGHAAPACGGTGGRAWFRRLAVAVCLALAPPLLTGCGDGEEHAIEQLLDDRVRALSSRNLALYEALIAADYSDDGETRRDLVRRMEGYFERFDSIELEVADREIERDGDTAWVSQAIRLRVSGLSQPMSDREVLELRKASGRWVIVGGL